MESIASFAERFYHALPDIPRLYTFEYIGLQDTKDMLALTYASAPSTSLTHRI